MYKSKKNDTDRSELRLGADAVPWTHRYIRRNTCRWGDPPGHPLTRVPEDQGLNVGLAGIPGWYLYFEKNFECIVDKIVDAFGALSGCSRQGPVNPSTSLMVLILIFNRRHHSSSHACFIHPGRPSNMWSKSFMYSIFLTTLTFHSSCTAWTNMTTSRAPSLFRAMCGRHPTWFGGFEVRW